ncbi:MAG: hypothetical protein KDA75_01815 [Planctomycetaceae bacterium]|nr:hypothetical protein [Planctomycetaceae bacterium]
MLLRLSIPFGLMTAVLLAAPSLVVMGLIFFIIPGLILAIIPTVFVYMLATALIGRALPQKLGYAGVLVAFPLALAASAAVMFPWRMREQAKFVEASLPDVVPPEELRLFGDILVDWSEFRPRPSDEVTCDALCVALLDTPGVTSVTRRTAKGTATFRRGADVTGTLVMPDKPQLILDKFHKLSGDRKLRKVEAMRQAEREFQAELALRTAEGDAIRRSDPIDISAIDWTIAYEELRESGQPRIERLEIRNNIGTVRARKSLVKHFVPAALFYFGFEGGSSADGFRGAKFTTGGSIASNQARFYDLDGTVELLRFAQIAEPQPRPNITERLNDRLLTILDDPQASDAELLVARLWLAQFQYNADDAAVPTIAKILLDPRVPDPSDLLRQALHARTDLSLLRSGLARRFLTTTEPKSRNWYISTLVELPPGTFAEPTVDEIEIWSQAQSDAAAAPFVERMADRGPEVVPELLALLDASLPQPWHARWRILDGIREALTRLGPEAAMAAPRIQALIEESPRSLLNSYSDRKEWLVALHLMGVGADDLPYGAGSRDPAQIASEFKRVEQGVQRYKQEHAVPHR